MLKPIMLKKTLLISLCALLTLGAFSCSKPIDVFTIKQEDSDRAGEVDLTRLKALNLITKKKKRVLMSFKPISGNESQNIEYTKVKNYYQQNLARFATFEIFIDPQYNQPGFSPISLRREDIITNFDYAVFFGGNYLKFSQSDGVFDYELHIKAEYYQIFNQKLINVHESTVQPRGMDELEESIKKFSMLYFPLKGIVQETKGGKHIAKINIGASTGLQLGVKILFRDIDFSQDISDSSKGANIASSVVNYSEDVKGTGEVVFMDNEFSWVEVDEKSRPNISVGMAAFVSP